MQMVEWFLNLRLVGCSQYNLYLHVLQRELVVVF